MIEIGENWISFEKGLPRLCAKVSIDDRKSLMWFSLNLPREKYLSAGRADPFVMALLPAAMEGGHEIRCADRLSARLRYQLEVQLAPTLAQEKDGKFYQPLRITAPLTEEPYPSIGAVGAGFSSAESFAYTAQCHGRESLYPLTHVIVPNTGNREERKTFQENCQKAALFAKEQNWEAVWVDNNLDEILWEKPQEVAVFRSLACALALEGLLAVYLLPAKRPAADFHLDRKDCSSYELLAAGCGSTETTAVYLSGGERNCKGTKSPVLPGKEKPPIRIQKPYITHVSGSARLCAEVTLHGEEKILWFSVKEEYAPYFTLDRVDPFAAALLTTAMRDGTDIVCEYPVTRRLLYQLNQYLIPTITSNIPKYHPVQIYAEPADREIKCQGAVATGWTGGVDSLFSLMQSLAQPDSHRLTHLMITSNGAIEGPDPFHTLEKMLEKAEKGIGAELDLRLIGIDTNLRQVLPENFKAVVPIRHGAVILALQKLFRVYFSGSSRAFSQLSLEEESMQGYEPILLGCLETDSTVFYSAGSPFKRVEKLRQLSDFPLATRYLHPCIYALRDNCGTCEKCLRTQAALYALGTLDRFSPVFDREKFKKEKDRYFAKIMVNAEQMPHYMEILEACQENGADLAKAKGYAKRLRLRKKLGSWKALLPPWNK